MYNTMQYANKNTTEYLDRLRNAQKVNEACNGRLITNGIHEHGMKILFPLHNNGFDFTKEDNKKDTEKAGEEMLCAILYMENSDKAGFANLEKRVWNDYVLNKAEYPRMVTTIHSLLLNYQPNYNYNRNYHSNRGQKPAHVCATRENCRWQRRRKI